jgi:hypothetical protein
VRDLHVRFGSGRDVLNAYWGYLSDGGLILPHQGLAIGDSVALEVRVDSTQTDYALAGTVVRLDPRSCQMVVRFSPGEPHDMLLTDALSETDNVPARRHRRYRVERTGELSGPTGGHAVRVVDISEGGVCVQLGVGEIAGPPVAIGADVQVAWDGVSLRGRVVWSRHTERGIEFDAAQRADARDLVRRLSDGLRRPTGTPGAVGAPG